MNDKNKILGISAAGLGLEGMDIMIYSFALASIISTMHLSNVQAGSIATVCNFGMLIGGILFGYLADKYDRVKMFSLTIIIFTVFTFLTAFANNLESLYILRFMSGIGGGGEYGIGMAMVATAFSQSERGKAISYVCIGGQLGAILAAVLAAILLPTLGWRALFAVGILPIVLVYFAHKYIDPSMVDVKSDVKEKVSPLSLFNSKKNICMFILLTIMAAVQVSGYYGLMTWLPSILQKEIGLSVVGSSLWMISTVIGMILGMVLFGRLFDKLGFFKTYALFLAVSAVAVFIYVWVSSPIGLLIGGAVVGFFVNGMSAGYGALISSCFPEEVRSYANNFIFNIGRSIGGLSPIIIGYLIQYHSLYAGMSYLSATYVVSIISVYLLTYIMNTKAK